MRKDDAVKFRREVHRIVTSEHYRASLIEVQPDRNIDDIADAHEVLDVIAQMQSEASRRHSAGAILVRDTQGATVFAGAQAWIMGWPKMSVGKKIGDKEWKIRVASLEAFHG